MEVMPVMSTSTGNDISTPQSDSASISPTLLIGSTKFRALDNYVSAMHLSEDVPLRSIERDSSDSSGGANMSRATEAFHVGAPSLFFIPPASAPEDLRGSPVISGRASSVDNRLGMSEIANALEGVRNSNRSNAFLRPQSPTVGDSPTRRHVSRRRSSSRTDQPPHNVADEELPKERFHDSAFQEAFLQARQIMSEFTNVLSSNSTHSHLDSTMKRLHEGAGNLARFHCPSTRIVGFVGDSGAGKSSLLNSLLDHPGLARASNSGRACTCVVTEYHYHNTDDFAIEVEWFSLDEVVAQLAEFLQSYRRYHLDPEGSITIKDQLNAAQDTFRAMVRGRFEDERFLIQSPEETVMETLRLWARELLPSSAHSREVYASLEDCGSRLEQLTSEQDSTQELAKWPFIRKVKVFSNAYILSNGLVLVDLPGLRDLNLARRTITERYLLECDGIFAVCAIGRATTDVSVTSVFDLAKQAKLSNVGIVCTRSDDTKAEEARYPVEKANKIQLFLEAIAKDELDLKNVEADIASYQDIGNDDLCEEEVKDFSGLFKRRAQLMKRQDEHEFELKKYLISTRNDEVKTKLSIMYANKISGNHLEVFCVSNDVYWQHRKLPKDGALRFLQLSGILTVRKHCISMVAKSQLSIARKYITDDIPALLGEAELWVQSGAGSMDAERKEKIRKTLDRVEARLKRGLTRDTSQINKIERSFTELFRDEISSRQRINNWCQAAIKASIIWSDTYSAMTYKLFCQKFGIHDTGMVGKQNWNEEAIKEMVKDLASPWQNLESTFQSSLEGDIKFVKDLMDQAIQRIDAGLRHSPDSADALCRTMRSRQRLLVTDLELACEKFQAGLSTLRADAFSGIHTSFIGQLMDESYKKCNGERGLGSHIRRSKIITNRLGDRTLFVSIQTKFRVQFGTLAESLQSDVEDAVATHLVFITNTFDIIRNENVALESESDPEFRRRVEMEVMAAKQKIHILQDVMSS